MTINQEQIKMKISNRLKLFRERLETTQIILRNEIEVNSEQFRTKEGVEQIVSKIENINTPIIYRFSIESRERRSGLINIYKDFNYDNKQKDRGKDRRNISRFNDTNTNSETLYVGSKMSKPRSRIKQHLGEGYFRTFSLHLNKWDLGLDYNLKIEIFDIISDIETELKRNFIELIEQEIWDQYQPIFGKKSGL